MSDKSNKWANLITIAAPTLSIFSVIIYGTWFVSSIDKRVSLLESDNLQMNQDIDEYRQDQKLINSKQDIDTHRFEDQIIKRISRIEDRINYSECNGCSIHKLEVSLIED